MKSKFWMLRLGLMSAGMVVGAYHGWKRHGSSIPYAAAWAVGSTLMPEVALGIIAAQGVGKKP